MMRRHTRSTLTDTPLPYTTLCRSTFTVECKAVARMSDIHDAFGATDPAHRRRLVGCGRKARGKSRNFTRKCGFVDRPDRRAERVLREEMLDVEIGRAHV